MQEQQDLEILSDINAPNLIHVLEEHGIGVADIKKLQDAGFNTGS